MLVFSARANDVQIIRSQTRTRHSMLPKTDQRIFHHVCRILRATKEGGQDEADTTRAMPMPPIQEETVEPTLDEQPVYRSPVNETKNNAETSEDLFEFSDDLKIEDITDAKLTEGADSSQNDFAMPKQTDPCHPEANDGEYCSRVLFERWVIFGKAENCGA